MYLPYHALRPCLLPLALLLLTGAAHAQTGPGGIGDRASTLLWLRADQGTFLSGTTPTQAGEAVATWRDGSGNGHDVTCSRDYGRPTLQPDSLNGKPVLRFTNDLCSVSGWSGTNGPITPATVFVVWNKPTDAGGAHQRIFSSGPSGQPDYLHNGAYLSSNTGSNNDGQGITGPHLSVRRYEDNRVLSNFKVGVLNAYPGSGYPSNGFYGDLAEIIVYDEALPPGEQSAVQNYLALKYHVGTSTAANPAIAAAQRGVFVLGETGTVVTLVENADPDGGALEAMTGAAPSGTPPGDADAVLPDRFWTISAPGLSGVTFSASFDLGGFAGLPDDFRQLRLLFRADASAPWQDVAALPGAEIVYAAPYLTATGLTTFGEFAIGRSSVVRYTPVAIEGRVTRSGQPFSNVAVRLSGDADRRTFTDEEGRFFFGDLPAAGSYSVTPEGPGLTFAPASSSFSGLLRDTTAHFAATLLPLSGDYTLGGEDADFRSFGQASSALMAQGVSGPVTILVRAGTYTEQGGHARVLDLPAQIAGISEANHLTIRPAEGVSREEVVLMRSAGAEGYYDGYVADVRTDYVTLENLTFRNADTTGAQHAAGVLVYVERSNADPNRQLNGVIIRGCRFEGADNADGRNTSRDGFLVLYEVAGLELLDNEFDNVSEGIRLIGNPGKRDVRIEGNRFTRLAYYGSAEGNGIQMENVVRPVVRYNVLDYAGGSGQTAINLSGVRDYVVEGNQVLNVNSGGIYGSFTGMRISTFYNAATTGLIANNFISVNTPRRTGLQLTGSSDGGDDITVAHNTVYLPARGIDHFGGSSAFQITDGRTDGVRVLNNVFVDLSTNASVVLQIADTTGNTSDYNLLYSAINRLVRANSVDYNDLAAWKETGFDAHSTSKQPEIVHPHRDLHLTGASVGDTDLIGLFLEDVPLDIDREERDATLPYMGADEASPFPGGKPIARDDVATTFEDTDVAIDVLANDFDPDGSALTVHALGTAGTIGTVVIEGQGVRFTPAAGFVGRDRFTYTVRNSAGIPDEGIVIVNVVSKPPDLVVEAVEGPSEGFSGQDVEVAWTVANVGTGSTNAPQWHDQIWLSADSANGSQPLVTVVPKNLTYLRSGERYTNRLTLTLPHDAEAGDYWVFANADRSDAQPESDEANNRHRSPAPVRVGRTPSPDLLVTALTLPDDGFSGQPITVSWTVTNEGSGVTDVEAWEDRIYGTTSPTLQGAQTLGTFPHTGALHPDSSYHRTATVTLPNAISGPYYVFAATDVSRRVYEEGILDQNNSRSDSLHVVLAPPPDLVPTVVVAPATARSGQTISVSWTVENRGAGAPFERRWTDRLYLSPSATFDPEAAVVLASVPRTPPFAPGAAYTAKTDARLPDSLSGTFHLFVEADVNGDVFEQTFDGNNRFRLDQPLQVTLAPPPDLVVTAVDAPANATAGASIEVGWTTENAGTGDAPGGWTDYVYLVPGTEWDEGEAIELGDAQRLGVLAAGESADAALDVTLPASLAPGTYMVFVEADGDAEVYEHGAEQNNRRGAAVEVAPYPPVDLLATEVVAPDSAASGQTVPLAWRIVNAGTGRTLAQRWEDAVFLSQDTLRSDDDVRLTAIERRGALGGGDGYDRTSTVQLPQNVSGAFFLLVHADAQNDAGETDDANNVAAVPITLALTPPPDLRLAALDAASPGQAGQPITVRWTVENQGVGVTPDSVWYEAFYLSRYEAFDRTAVRLATFERRGALAPDTSYTDSLDVTLPAFASGAYFLHVQSDVGGDLFESNEGNNAAVLPLSVVLPLPSDLVVTGVTAPAAATPGEPVTVTYTVENRGLNAASGQMTDAVYVSTDATWSLDDPLVGLQARTVQLAPGGLSEIQVKTDFGNPYRADPQGNLTEVLPGVPPGDYYLIVRTDVRNNLREDDETNNTAVSGEPTTVTIPVLVAGTPVSGTLAVGGQRFFRADVPTGLDLRLAAEDDHPDGQRIEVLTGFGEVPGRSRFARAVVEPGAERVLYLPSSEAGVHYVMLHNPADRPLAFTLESAALGFEVVDVEPKRIGHVGAITLDIQGGGMRGVETVWLRGPGEAEIEAGLIRPLDATRLLARFSLPQLPLGMYDVVAVDSSGVETALEGGVQVETATGLQGAVYAAGPGRVRRGGTGTFTAYVRNTGNVNVPHALLGFMVRDRVMTSLAVAEARSPGLQNVPDIGFEPGPYALLEGGNVDMLPVYVSELRPGEAVTLTFAGPLVAETDYFTTEHLVLLSDSAFIEEQTAMANLIGGRVLDNPAFAGTPLAQSAAIPEEFARLYAATYRERSPFLAEDAARPDTIRLQPQVHYLMEEAYGVLALLAEQYAPDVSIADLYYLPPEEEDEEEETASSAPMGASHATASASITRKKKKKDLCEDVGGCTCCWASPAHERGLRLSSLADLEKTCLADDALQDGMGGRSATVRPPGCNPPPPASFDPNDILGPAGFGDARWIPVAQNLPYKIRFENDAKKATAAAQVVTVRQKLSPTLDPRTFRLGAFGFGPFTFEVPENRAFYQTRLDVRDSLGLFVDVTAGLDFETGEAFWAFRSVDPATGVLPVFDGFLPPNDTLGLGTGEGFVTYTVSVRPDAITLDRVDAEARIVFDVNEPIDTPPIFNTIDAEPPASGIDALPAEVEGNEVTLAFTQDDFGGSGALRYALYVATGDDGTFQHYATTDSTVVFTGEAEQEYRFFVRAEDGAGNREPMKSAADARVRLVTVVGAEAEEVPQRFELAQNYPNPFRTEATIRYALPRPARVTIEVFDLLGRRVAFLTRGEMRPPGWHTARADGSALASGVYFYRLTANDGEHTTRLSRRMVLVH